MLYEAAITQYHHFLLPQLGWLGWYRWHFWIPFTATKIMSLLQLPPQGAAQAVRNAKIARIAKATSVRPLTCLKSFRPILLLEACQFSLLILLDISIWDLKLRHKLIGGFLCVRLTLLVYFVERNAMICPSILFLTTPSNPLPNISTSLKQLTLRQPLPIFIHCQFNHFQSYLHQLRRLRPRPPLHHRWPIRNMHAPMHRNPPHKRPLQRSRHCRIPAKHARSNPDRAATPPRQTAPTSVAPHPRRTISQSTTVSTGPRCPPSPTNTFPGQKSP